MSSSTTPELKDDERVPLKAEMDNKGFEHSNANSQADVQAKNNEISEQRPEELNQTNNEGDEEQDILKYGAKHVIMLFVPVSFCMALVVLIISALPFYTLKGLYFAYTPFERDENLETGTKIWQSMVNALIMLVVVVCLTFFLFILYKYRCYKFIYGWLFCSSLMLLFIFISIFAKQLIDYLDITIDYISAAFMLWNFGVVGMINVHWKGPLILQQTYLLVLSALMAVTFIKHLPDWTTWALLAGISIWDLVAVLSPKGPLHNLVTLAQERNEPIFPALIYSTTMVWKVEGGGENSREMEVMEGEGSDGESEKNEKNNKKRESEREGSDDTNKDTKGDTEAETKVDTEADTKEGVKKDTDEDEGTESMGGAGMTPNTDETSVIERVSNDAENKDDGGKGDGVVGGDSGEGYGVVVRDGIVVGGGRIVRDGVVLAVDGGRRGDDEPPILIPIPVDGDTAEIRVINANNSSEEPKDKRRRKKKSGLKKEKADDDDDSGVKLGLGDFIFYSILVGKASTTGDWNTTIACFIAILIGLCSTLLLLAIFKKALPALPISVSFGLIFYFATSQLVRPFIATLTAAQVFI